MVRNVFHSREGNIVTLKIDLSEPIIAAAKPSASTGKSLLLASASGEVVDITTGARLNLSVTMENPNAEQDMALAAQRNREKAQLALLKAQARLDKLTQ